jgi:hypothetical protein
VNIITQRTVKLVHHVAATVEENTEQMVQDETKEPDLSAL